MAPYVDCELLSKKLKNSLFMSFEARKENIEVIDLFCYPFNTRVERYVKNYTTFSKMKKMYTSHLEVSKRMVSGMLEKECPRPNSA